MTNTTKQAEMLKNWPIKLYVESINKDARCSGTVFTTPSPLSENYIRADTVRALQLEAIRKALEVASNKAAELHKMFGVSGLCIAEQIAQLAEEEILNSLEVVK
jgi:hypothetical protein